MIEPKRFIPKTIDVIGLKDENCSVIYFGAAKEKFTGKEYTALEEFLFHSTPQQHHDIIRYMKGEIDTLIPLTMNQISYISHCIEFNNY